MDKEQYVELLNHISGLKKTVLDNYEYKDELNKIIEGSKKVYEIHYNALITSDLKKYAKLLAEQNKYLLNPLEESLRKQQEYLKNLAPNLPEEIKKLSSIYDAKEQWQKELEGLDVLMKLSGENTISSDELRTKNAKVTNEKKDKGEKMGIKIKTIKLSNFRFFIDDEKNNTFEPNGENLLIYGENGSGKSSLYKAFELLSKTKVEEDEFADSINIFSNETDTYLTFAFNNGENITIDKDHLEIGDDYNYVKNLSVFQPLLNYQNLLQISYDVQKKKKEKNLYEFFETILEKYPIHGNKILTDLDGEEYFGEYKRIIQDELFADINLFLEKFEHNFKIVAIKFDGFSKTVFLEIEYFEEDIGKKYHLFLNEARLSALAISVYFSIMKKQFDNLDDASLKILVLDDLLISLDMNNRLYLIDILKSEFSDFQIFFFTHDRGLFEVFKEKMNWKAYEIYVAKKDNFEVPFIKQANPLLDQAGQQKDSQNYGCSANLLRQCTEEFLCKFLKYELTIGDRCKVLELDKLLNKAIKFENTKEEDKNQIIIDTLQKLKTFKRVLLNDASHYNDTNIYKNELEDTIDSLTILKSELGI